MSACKNSFFIPIDEIYLQFFYFFLKIKFIFAVRTNDDMQLNHISILNYKNIQEADLSLSPKLNCFIGSNGEGKTNILDAVYFLSFCKSANNSVDSQVIRHGDDFFVIQGQYVSEQNDAEDIYCGMKRGTKKRFRRNKKDYKKLSEHIGLIPLVMVSPDDAELISGGSEVRRKFMDVVISQYDREYLDALIRYNKALLQRNTLLKMEEEPDWTLVSLWEEQMAIEGDKIFKARTEFISAFMPIFQKFYQLISSEHETVELEYVSHGQRGNLLDVIQRDRAKDRIVGYSLHGVHKDDLIMSLGGFPLKKEGSQGQCKTFVVALKFAQFDFLRRTGRKTTPILLLDDIFDKLDARRVEQIVKLVASDEFGQTFITDTNKDNLDAILSSMNGEYKLFDVSAGEIKERHV